MLNLLSPIMVNLQINKLLNECNQKHVTITMYSFGVSGDHGVIPVKEIDWQISEFPITNGSTLLARTSFPSQIHVSSIIESNSDKQIIKITDLQGKTMLLKSVFGHENSVSLKDFKAGLYVIEICSDQFTIYKCR